MSVQAEVRDAGSGIERGLAALAVALPWLNPFAPGPSSPVVPWLVSFGCGVALWGLAMARGARLRTGLLGAAALALAWACAWNPPSTSDGLAWAGGLLLIVLSASAADLPALAKGVRDGLLAAAVVSAVIGLLQYLGAGPALSPWVSTAPVGEAYGNLRQPNQFATLCAIGFAVVLWPGPRLSSPVRFGLAVLLAAGTAASVSRTGMVELAVLAAFAAWWPGPQRRSRMLLALAGAVVYVATAAFLPGLAEAWTGIAPARTFWGRLGTGEACSSRMALWSNVLHLVTLRPWTGWGLGELDFAHFATLYDGLRFCEILDNAHNLPLHLAVEAGIPLAAVVCVGALGWALRRRPWREQANERQLAWALVAVIVLHSLLEYPLWYGPFQVAFGFALGQLTTGATTPARRPRVAVAACALLLGAAGYAAWDYARVSQIYLPAQRRAAAWRDDPLAHARRSWLFSEQARFAALTLTSPSRANAEDMLEQSLRELHYSPEPRVIERAIESAVILGRDGEATALLARYRAAFPREADAWLRRSRGAAQD